MIADFDSAEQELRNVEKSIEEVGRFVCNIPDSLVCWNKINTTLATTQDAIRELINLKSMREV